MEKDDKSFDYLVPSTYEADLDFDFDIQADSLLDLISGNAPSIMEISQQIRTRWAKVQQQTDQWRLKLNSKGEEFIKERQARMRQTLRKQETVRLRDKITFVLGVTYIWVTSLILAGAPNWMPAYYFVITLPLITLRYFYYKSMKWHYFLADLCYFVNLLTTVFLFFTPKSTMLFSATFALANGPVAMAIYAWRNALVFHSLDKITSIVIHIMPALTLYSVRWLSYGQDNSIVPSYDLFSFRMGESKDIGLVMPIIYGIGIYLFWQSVYYYFIFIRRANNVYSGTHATSFTYMLADYMKHRKESPLSKLFLRTRTEYQPFLFMLLNLGYAIATLLPTVLFYRYFYLHTIYIVFVVMVSVFNGASYYIEVFSKRYRLELEELASAAHTPSTSDEISTVDSTKKEN